MGREWLNCRSHISNNRSQVAKAGVSRSTVWTPFSTHLHLPSGQHKYLRAERSCEQSEPSAAEGARILPPHTPQQSPRTLGLLSPFPLRQNPPDGGASLQVSQFLCVISNSSKIPLQGWHHLCIFHNTSQQQFKFYSYQISFPTAWCLQNIVLETETTD